MRNIFGITFPVSLFLFQLWICVQLGYDKLVIYYSCFLISYGFGVLLATFKKVNLGGNYELSSRFFFYAKVFVYIKSVVVFYYLLIFIEYYIANGYLNIRGYIVSDAIKTSIYYSALFMYVDSYILVPLNFILLTIFFIANKTKYALALFALLIIQYVIIFAGRGMFYIIVVLLLAWMLHRRMSFVRFIVRSIPMIGIIIGLSVFMVSVRDMTSERRSNEEAFYSSAVMYHFVSPTILNELIETSTFYKSQTGYGLATFGFIFDPIIYVFAAGSKDYMFSKKLSAETQNFVLQVGESDQYNAFATFLFAALFDFGFFGPFIYGIFFGYFIQNSYRRRDPVGCTIYVILSFFVYFNSFTFFITGEWFFVLLIAPLAWQQIRVRNTSS